MFAFRELFSDYICLLTLEYEAIHPSIHSQRPCVSCGRCTCLEFLATQCSVHVVARILLSASKDSPVSCVISSLTLKAVLELNFVQCPCNSSVIASLKIYSFIHSFIQLSVEKKGKVPPTHYRALGPELIPVYRPLARM